MLILYIYYIFFFLLLLYNFRFLNIIFCHENLINVMRLKPTFWFDVEKYISEQNYVCVVKRYLILYIVLKFSKYKIYVKVIKILIPLWFLFLGGDIPTRSHQPQNTSTRYLFRVACRYAFCSCGGPSGGRSDIESDPA